MDVIYNLGTGFAVALTPQNLTFAFLGSVLGTLIGVLPGIGPVAGVAMLIPLTFQMSPTGAIIMLTALFYGTQYGGTITSVLLNVPGEAGCRITCIDGGPFELSSGAVLATNGHVHEEMLVYLKEREA
jgi:putative tricarboxylic transport membrane protein